MIKSGQSCPIEYQYKAKDFSVAPAIAAKTIYVVGGLYGNLDALHEILRMQDAEKRAGTDVQLVFNGDHNWFNTNPSSFREINQIVLENFAIRGNVEAEIAASVDAGCGCNYPDYVNQQYVARSNAIMTKLQQTAREFTSICDGLNRLPLIRTVDLDGKKIGIVHGDAEMLAGWAFAAERLSPIGKCCSGDEAGAELTPRALIERYFVDAGVLGFASTHTCLAHAKDFFVGGQDRVIMNNGAAGLPNFANTSYGMITRISVDPHIPENSLYGAWVSGLRYDSLAVNYDTAIWLRRFLTDWQPGSAAYEAYFNRIVAGPNFDLSDAVSGQFRPPNH